MNTKITKKRLNDLLSYDWIKIIALIVAGIVVWSMAFTVGAVRLTAGQQFKIFLAHDVGAGDLLSGYGNDLKERKVLSYDVIEFSYESLLKGSSDTVLSARFAVDEGDIMVLSETDFINEGKNEGNTYNDFVDRYFDAYPLDTLMADAKAYYSDFYEENGSLKTGYVNEYFRQRMKKDNRFKTKTQYEEGALLEIERIQTLKRAWTALDAFLNENPDVLANYARYTQAKALSPEMEVTPEETARPYGLRLDGTAGADNYFKISGGGTQGLILTVLNRKNKQKDLQYEVIPVICDLLKIDFTAA